MITRRDLIKEKLADFVKVNIMLAECHSIIGKAFEAKKHIEKAGAAILLFQLMGAGKAETKKAFASYYEAFPKCEENFMPTRRRLFTFTKSVRYLIEMGLHFSNMKGESKEDKEISKQNAIAAICIFELCATKEEKKVWGAPLKDIVFNVKGAGDFYVTAPRLH